jgi:hypothetical protein
MRAGGRFFPQAASQFVIFRGEFDRLPSEAAAQRAIRLRHDASIGAPLKLRKLSGPVESAHSVEKYSNPQMNTDKHR